MNVREGTRRLGIVLGLCGAILGGYLEHGHARAVWHNYRAAKRFESLSASPAIQRVAEGIKEYRNGPLATYPWINYTFNQQSGKLEYHADIIRLLADSHFQKLDTPSQKTVLGQIDSRFSGLSESDLQSIKHRMAPIAVEADAVNQRKPGDTPDKAIKVLVNAGGIKEVLAGKDGISQIHLSTGESVRRTDDPSPMGYLRLLLYPLLGFLLPLVSVCIITWVASGFFAPTPKQHEDLSQWPS
jgi:hypothetical protein